MQTYFAEIVLALTAVLQPAGTPNWTPATRLEADLGMDSGLMLELIMHLEEVVPDLVIDHASLTYEQFATIGSVGQFIHLNRKQDAVA
jgi:acyl carrier protein